MSYVAEPYAQFVDDLLTSLTGGVVREGFTFDPEQAPFRLSPPGPLALNSLRVYGQSRAEFVRFVKDRDYALNPDQSLSWNAAAAGGPAAGARWPDEGTAFFANYDHLGPAGTAPLLNDRNPGSITRLLAESFAREFAVLSRQLDAIYKAGFAATATGRDLDQVVALVGVTRSTATHATGYVVFSRNATGDDIAIPAGTRLSTNVPPNVTFETSEEQTLRRGEFSVEVPVRALEQGPSGVVEPGTISVIHRPIAGVTQVSNSEATRQVGANETDEQLRARAKRALEAAGRATVGAMVGALTALPDVRENFVRVAEEHLDRPGVVTLYLAASLDPVQAVRARRIIEDTRPAGVRVLSNFDTPPPPGGYLPPVNTVDDSFEGAAAPPVQDTLYQYVHVRAVLLSQATSLSAKDRADLVARARAAVHAFVDAAGIGESLIYSRLVAQLVNLSGVQDVAVELYPEVAAGAQPGHRRQNLTPPRTLRPRLKDEQLLVEIAGELVAFDVEVDITLTDSGLAIDRTVMLETARVQIMAELQDALATLSGPLTPATMLPKIDATEYYAATAITYKVEYVEAGVVLMEPSPELTLQELERPWIRTLSTREATS